MHNAVGKTLITILFAGCLGAAGCGDDAAAGPDANLSNPIGCEGTERYWALVEGATWSFQITDPSDASKRSTKSQTIGAVEAVPGKAGVMANKVVTTKPGGDVTSWQEDTGDAIRRHREEDRAGSNHSDELYNPYKLRIDESGDRTTVGTTWMETYDEVITDVTGGTGTMTVAKTETWSIVAIDEIIGVPAGAFCTLRVRKVSSATGGTGGSDKTYWFARGIGKVKEESATQREELDSYTIP